MFALKRRKAVFPCIARYYSFKEVVFMIQTVLTHIKEAVSRSLSMELGHKDDRVVLSNLVNPDGSLPENLDTKIVCFLVHIDEDTSFKSSFTRPQKNSDSLDDMQPLINYNLHLMFCANFTGEAYSEGLTYLSSVVQFFENHKIMRPEAPDHPLYTTKLQIEKLHLDYSQISQLWSAIGSALMPSVLYKVRFQASAQGEKNPSIV